MRVRYVLVQFEIFFYSILDKTNFVCNKDYELNFGNAIFHVKLDASDMSNEIQFQHMAFQNCF